METEMIDALGQMTERCYKAEAERDEALAVAKCRGKEIRAREDEIEFLERERDEAQALLASETRDCQRFLRERDEARAVARWRINVCRCDECDQARDQYPWLDEGDGWNPAHDEEEL